MHMQAGGPRKVASILGMFLLTAVRYPGSLLIAKLKVPQGGLGRGRLSVSVPRNDDDPARLRGALLATQQTLSASRCSASAITPPRTMLYENRYYSKALLPANPGNGQVTSELCYTDAARMRVHGTEPSTPPVTTQQAASFPKPPSEHASPEKARMLPSLYGMPAQEMGNSSKGSLMAQCIDSPGEDGPRRMAIERTMLSVRGKSSNQVRATFVPEDAAPLEGRATTRTQLLANRRAELEAANAQIGRDRQTTLPKGVQPGAPGKRPDATRFTCNEVLMGAKDERGAYLASTFVPRQSQ